MTDLLTPPPEHDLPPRRAEEIRRAVLRSAGEPGRRRPGRRAWFLVPAAAALVTVVAVVGLRPTTSPTVIGSPSPAPSVTSSGLPDDGALSTDAGPLSHADAVAVVNHLNSRRPRSQQAPLADVLVARRTTTALGDGTFVVWTDTTGSTWWAADSPHVMGTAGPLSGPAATSPARVPDATHPVVRTTDLATFGWTMAADRPDARASDLYAPNLYRVSPSVARVEVRMTVEGKAGPWFTAPVFDGYTFVPAVTPGAHSTTEDVDKVTTVTDRAFDEDGELVDISGR